MLFRSKLLCNLNGNFHTSEKLEHSQQALSRDLLERGSIGQQLEELMGPLGIEIWYVRANRLSYLPLISFTLHNVDYRLNSTFAGKGTNAC